MPAYRIRAVVGSDGCSCLLVTDLRDTRTKRKYFSQTTEYSCTSLPFSA
jgi:hypothetical protein